MRYFAAWKIWSTKFAVSILILEGRKYTVSEIRSPPISVMYVVYHLYWRGAVPRYHPLTPRADHVGLWLGFSWKMIFVPGVASGTLLKLKVPFSCSSADFRLLSLDVRRRFRVRVA